MPRQLGELPRKMSKVCTETVGKRWVHTPLCVQHGAPELPFWLRHLRWAWRCSGPGLPPALRPQAVPGVGALRDRGELLSLACTHCLLEARSSRWYSTPRSSSGSMWWDGRFAFRATFPQRPGGNASELKAAAWNGGRAPAAFDTLDRT